jgi:transposase
MLGVMLVGMKRPIFVRELTDEEGGQLERGLRSSDAFVLRRCQILLASARGEIAPVIARNLGCSSETVRTAITAFNQRGLECLQAGSHRPHHIRQTAFPGEKAQRLLALLDKSPRDFGKPRSLWTLDLAAQVSFEQGLSERLVSGEAVRLTLLRLGKRWGKAKRWIESGDPQYAWKKAGATG